MTRLEVIKAIRKGQRIEVLFTPETHAVVQPFVVMIYHVEHCDFERKRQPEHERIGPIHCMFWSGSRPFWLHITAKQLLGFIRRNYPRK